MKRKSSELLATLQTLEQVLHEPATRMSAAKLDELLHDDFFEIGRSGKLHNKASVLSELAMEEGLRKIHSHDFKLTILSEGCALLIYRTSELGKRGEMYRHTRRSSVWINMSGGWKMRFHQGTAVDSNPSLQAT